MTDLDIAARLRSLLPARWFSDLTPVLDGVLLGLAAGWNQIWGIIDYAGRQTRIATASDGWLDRIAVDYFGSRIRRRERESDNNFSVRIRRELLRERGTRGAIISALTDLTGRAPLIFEPARPADTGAWGRMGYGLAGAWGNLNLPYQCFVTAFRPMGSGIPVVSGWNAPSAGWGLGAIEYASLTMVVGQIADRDIYAAAADAMPVAAIAWARITN